MVWCGGVSIVMPYVCVHVCFVAGHGHGHGHDHKGEHEHGGEAHDHKGHDHEAPHQHGKFTLPVH